MFLLYSPSTNRKRSNITAAVSAATTSIVWLDAAMFVKVNSSGYTAHGLQLVAVMTVASDVLEK